MAIRYAVDLTDTERAELRETLIGSRALVVYVDVDGPSAANNRPWLRK